MKHFASPNYWFHFRQLPEEVQTLAQKNFDLLKLDPRHSSVRLKKVGDLWSARIGLGYRAIGWMIEDGILWDWIGPHDEYDRLISA